MDFYAQIILTCSEQTYLRVTQPAKWPFTLWMSLYFRSLATGQWPVSQRASIPSLSGTSTILFTRQILYFGGKGELLLCWCKVLNVWCHLTRQFHHYWFNNLEPNWVLLDSSQDSMFQRMPTWQPNSHLENHKDSVQVLSQK